MELICCGMAVLVMALLRKGWDQNRTAKAMEWQRKEENCKGIAKQGDGMELHPIAKAWRRKDMKCRGREKRSGAVAKKCIDSVTVH